MEERREHFCKVFIDKIRYRQIGVEIMDSWYKLVKMPDGNVETVISLYFRDSMHECITQGKGAFKMTRQMFKECPDGVMTKMVRVHIDHLEKIGSGGDPRIWDSEALSREWGRLRGKDKLISKKEALVRINTKIAGTGYVAEFNEWDTRERSLSSTVFKKAVKPTGELYDMLLKCKILGLGRPTEWDYPELKGLLYGVVGKTGILRSPYTHRSTVKIRNDEFVEHELVVRWPILCTEIGVMNYIGEMEKILRYGVEI